MSFSIQVRLVESSSEIAKNINEILAKQINRRLPRVFARSQDVIKEQVLSGIRNQPEYQALISGSLKHEFGLPDAGSRVESILKTLEQSMVVKYEKSLGTPGGVRGGFIIEFIKADYSDILSSPEATFTTEKGSNLEWLNWLLVQGDNSIVLGYEFVIGSSVFSRTGSGIMKSNLSGFWRVPPEYAGTLDNNWITRGILSVESIIEKYLVELIQDM